MESAKQPEKTMAKISPTRGFSGKNIGPTAAAARILRGSKSGFNFRMEKPKLNRPVRELKEELGLV